ncbi:virion structural protein [Aureococcus anophagefferens virus]|uniref:Putative concanavalin A-like lectin/glucanase superfamily protein n=1 Tax=Aureococcus anophagefferens virus TaxID=1474867 RepID=A0A076FID6_9VIRU|nr:virion structural protein [Aureococcus anophagefferens virus]AII17216.1 putative concanavalin A-like lectin/glucanase superfamily protein [Aureococcus anophagefferens virus]
MRLIRTSGSNPLRIKEFQMFINDDNKAPFKTRFTSVSGTSNRYKMNNDNFGDVYFSTFGTIGNYAGIDFGAYFSKYDIQSIVHYNNTTDQNNAIGISIELLNTNDNVRVSSSEISSGKLYYRFDGPRISDAILSTSASTTAVIDIPADTESLTEVTDLSTLNYLFSKVRLIRTSRHNYGFLIKELQLFINGENKASNTKSENTVFSTFVAQTSYPLENINSGLNNELRPSGSLSAGDNCGVNLNSYFSKYDIVSVVVYHRGGWGNAAIGITIELLNANENIRVSSSEISLGKNYYRFDGPRIGDATLSSSNSTIAVIDDSSNTESLTTYSINVIANLSNIVLYLDAANTNSYLGTGTTWTDLSGQSNNGTLINGPGYDSGNGGSIVFDGSNDYVSETSGLSDSFLQGNWTISFWVNFDSLNTGTTSDDKILLQHGSFAVNKGLHLDQRNSRIHFGLIGNDIQGSTIVSTNTWYHVTFTLNNTSRAKQIFINGSLDNPHTGNGAYTGTGSNTRIGGEVVTFGQPFDGKMASVIAYSEVLTSSQIADNYNAFKARYGHV